MLAMPETVPNVIDAKALLERERTLSSITSAPDALPDERLTETQKRLLSYWKIKRDRYDAPCRSDIDPCDLGPVLPNIILWEIDDEDYRCRLAGTSVCDNLLPRMHGILLGDLPCPLIDVARREFDAARDEGLGTLAERTLHWLGRPLIYYRHLLLPLVNDRGERHMLLSAMTFHNVAER
jgi:hypothetical protein